jgi:hypothetical protein
MRPTTRTMIVVIVALAAMTNLALAQRTTATFAGIVTDPSKAVLPGAEVKLINEGTNAVTEKLTGETGEFVFDYVPVGTYTLKIEMPGFKTYESKSIPLGAAQSLRRTYSLSVGEITESVMVTGEAPLVNTLSPEQRVGMESLEVKTMPMINRDITSLLNVGTGLTTRAESEGNAGSKFRLNGLGSTAMAVTANGTDANGNPGSPTISGYYGYTKINVMSSEAVGEMQVVKGVTPAEYGMAMGGQMSVITKSGTNEWHGSVFHRYEGSVLSARPQFLTQKNNSVWNQFGGSFGGPIEKDKAFFFFAYEGYRQRSVVPLNPTVPTQRFRDILLQYLPFQETRTLLNYYPLPNTPLSAPDALLGVWNGPGAKSANDDHIDAKIDFPIAGGNLSITAAISHPQLIIPTDTPQNPKDFSSRWRRLSLNYVLGRGPWTFSSRAGYNIARLWRVQKWWYENDPNKPETISGMRNIKNISFPGLTAVKGESHVRSRTPTYMVEQHVGYMHGTHSFKVGGMLYLPSGGNPDTDAGNVAFQTVADVMANTPSGISFDSGRPDHRWRFVNFGFFGQDDWRVNRKLVLNLGLRYDRFGHFVPHALHPDDPFGFIGVFNLDGFCGCKDFVWTGKLRDTENPFNSDNFSLAPRVGFAYTLDDAGDFVLRGGYGINFQGYDAQTFEDRLGRGPTIPNTQPTSRAEAAARGWKYPIYQEDMLRYFAAQPNIVVGALINPNLKPAYAMNYTLGIQKALTSTTMLDTSYVGTRGVKFPMGRTYNQVDRITGIRPNPSMGQGPYTDNSQETVFHSWQTSLKQRMTKGLLFAANYTWGKAMSYTGGGTALVAGGDTGGGVEDFFNVKIERSLSVGDVAHDFSMDVLYQVPTLFNNSTIGRHLFGGWQIAGIVKATTGEPLGVSQTGGRPDLLDGKAAINTKCCSFGNLQYLNRDAFALVPVVAASGRTERRGNMNPTSLRAPGFSNLNLSLAKIFSLTEDQTLELKADLQNALNQTQYMSVSTNLSSPNFGQVTATNGARIVQVQLRLAF